MRLCCTTHSKAPTVYAVGAFVILGIPSPVQGLYNAQDTTEALLQGSFMEDIIKSIKANLYDRAISPLSGTFAVSWTAWNYKFVVTLLSSMEAHDKFEYISTFLYATPYDCYGVGLGFPLLTTIAYIYVYPYIGNRVYGFSRARKKDLMEIKIKADKEEPISAERAKQLHKEMDELRHAQHEELDRKKAENKSLKSAIEDQEEVLKKHKTTIEELEKRSRELEHSIAIYKDTVESQKATITNLHAKLNEKTTLLSGGPADGGVTDKSMRELVASEKINMRLLMALDKNGPMDENLIKSDVTPDIDPSVTAKVLRALASFHLIEGVVNSHNRLNPRYTITNKGRNYLWQKEYPVD